MTFTGEHWKSLFEASTLTEAEKTYVFDFVLNNGGSFYLALMEAIAKADLMNRHRLALGFPAEVGAYVAWCDGDLHARVKALGREL